MTSPRQKLIHELFEAQVRLTPSAVALELEARQLTYLELNQKADRVARALLALGMGPETLVGICLPRSIELITGLIGILKAGGVYVALDPALPEEQLAFLMQDAKMPIMVTDQDSLKQLPRTSAHLVCLGSDGLPTSSKVLAVHSRAAEVHLEDDLNRESGMSDSHLAYVSFTSGSTGRPKGVCIPHRGVVRLVKNANYARLASDEVFLHWSSISFDASTFEIWGCLLNGGRLVIFPPGLPWLTELVKIVRSRRVTTLWLTSGLFNRVVEQNLSCLRGLRQLLIGGDVLSVPHVQEALASLKGCELINGYGPTENTTFTCCYPIRSPVIGHSVPIGRPISSTYVYILDPDGQPVVPGEAGELYIGGDGLARGYLNRPELTAQKFVPDPFHDSPDARLFRSGDRVRCLTDGNIEFLGRLDRQVKVRGFRVELDGVEAVLRECPGVQQAAVVANGEAGSRYLILNAAVHLNS